MEYIYKDFAEFIPHDIKGEPNCYIAKLADEDEGKMLKDLTDMLDSMSEHRYPSGINHKRNFPSEFIKYHEDSDESYDVVIHARNIGKAAMRNWPNNKWDELTNRLIDDGMGIAAIGAPGQAYVPPGASDRTTWDMKETIAVICSSKIVIGPSSGPMHLASLCGVKHLVWTHAVKKTAVRATNRDRYEKIWNPFNTPVCVIDNMDWNPSVDRVYDALRSTI
jgi:ADP-heptose:LPS heptosyltransferase